MSLTPKQQAQADYSYQELLRFAFNQIAPVDFRGIDAIVPWEAANIYMQAIEFMTSETPSCVRVPGLGMYARITTATSIVTRDSEH